MKLKYLLLVLMLTLFLASCSNEKIEDKEVNIADLSDSVFKLSVADENGNLIAEGSGFCIYDSKTLITNYHVIEDGYSITATSQNEIIYNIAGVYHYDEDRDIAILKLENSAKCPVLPIAKDYKVGEEVYAIGSPLGLKNTISNGLISAERENGEYIDLQISAPISSGSSGGALLNTKGEVVGVTYAGMIDAQNLNFVIPMTYFNSIELNNKEVKTLSMIIEEKIPGNIIENYSNGSRSPFVLDFIYDNNLFIVYEYTIDGESGLIIKSESLGIEEKLQGYHCPNYYRRNLYCIDAKSQTIVVINIEDILYRNYNFDSVMDCSIYQNYVNSIFVSDGRILTRIDDLVIISDICGNILDKFEDEGAKYAIMQNSNTLAYSYGENSIKVFNTETFKTDIICTTINFKYINGYHDGNYMLSDTFHDDAFAYTYNPTNSATETFKFERTDGYRPFAIMMYNDYLIMHDRKHGHFRIAHGKDMLDGDKCYIVQLTTGSKFNVPVNFTYYSDINYGRNNKMYIKGKKGENENYLYRMNLDCTGIEEIGLIERG